MSDDRTASERRRAGRVAHLLVFLTLVISLAMLSGCMRFDYVGREFAPTPDECPVDWYLNREQLPAGEYRIIGRATLEARDGTDGYDIRKKLLSKARAFGADAVCLVSSEKVPVGLYEQNPPWPGDQQPLDPANAAFRGSLPTIAAERRHYGPPVELTGERNSRQVVTVKALFLKNKTALEEALGYRTDIELDEILGEPVEPSTAPAETEDPATNYDDLSLPEYVEALAEEERLREQAGETATELPSTARPLPLPGAVLPDVQPAGDYDGTESILNAVPGQERLPLSEILPIEMKRQDSRE